MSHAMQGHPGWMGHNEEFRKPWSAEGGNGNPLQYSWHENPMNSIIRQKDMTLKDEPPGQRVSKMLLGKSGRQSLKASRGMKQLVQSGNFTVVDVLGGETLSPML